MNNSEILSSLAGENSEILEEVTTTFLEWKQQKIKFYKLTPKDVKQLIKLKNNIIKYCAHPVNFTKAQFYTYKDEYGFEANPLRFDVNSLNRPWAYDNYVSYRAIAVKPKIKDHYAEVLYNQNAELSCLLTERFISEDLDKQEILLDILLDKNADLFSWYRIVESVNLTDAQREKVKNSFNQQAINLATPQLFIELENKADLTILKELIKK